MCNICTSATTKLENLTLLNFDLCESMYTQTYENNSKAGQNLVSSLTRSRARSVHVYLKQLSRTFNDNIASSYFSSKNV